MLKEQVLNNFYPSNASYGTMVKRDVVYEILG